MHAHQRTQIAERPGHAPILEGGAGVLPLVFEGEAAADTGGQGGGRLYDGSVALAQIHNVLFLKHGGHQFVKAENAAQGGGTGGPAGVEQVAPVVGAGLGHGVEIQVFQQEDAPAVGAGVQQLIHAVARAALHAHVFHTSPAGGKIGRCRTGGDGRGGHGSSPCWPPLYGLCRREATPGRSHRSRFAG